MTYPQEGELMRAVRQYADHLGGDDVKLKRQLEYEGCVGIQMQLEQDKIMERMVKHRDYMAKRREKRKEEKR